MSDGKSGAKPKDDALADEMAGAEMPDEAQDALERSLAVQGERESEDGDDLAGGRGGGHGSGRDEEE